MTNSEDTSLVGKHPSADAESWRAVAEATLRGTSLDQLLSRLAERDSRRGEPARQLLYTRADAPDGDQRAPILDRQDKTGAAWDLRQPAVLREGATELQLDSIRRAVLEDLSGGATSLEVVLSRLDGTPTVKEVERQLERILEGVHLDYITVALDAGRHGNKAAQALLNVAAARDTAATVALNVDPIGAIAGRGGTAEQLRADLALTTSLAAGLESASAGLVVQSLVRSDGTLWNSAGSSDTQELAGLLATTAEYFRYLTASDEGAGLELSRIADLLSWRVAVTTQFFAQIAKLRAARLLRRRLLDACSVAPRPLQIEATTASRILTLRDNKVNLLRATATTFAAVLGGADVVTAAAFDAAALEVDEEESSRARRLARNTQVILMEESSLGRVADPAGGSWAVESQTAALARAAWQLFQEIERQGGMIEALASGWWQEQISRVAENRQRDIARRSLPITGVSAFPNLEDPTPSGFEPESSMDDGDLDIRPLRSQRNAEGFEELSAAADRAAQAGQRPTVFLANLGTLAESNARASFTENLLSAGGIASAASTASVSKGHDLEALAENFKTWSEEVGTELSGKAAILCSTDDRYLELAADAARALKQAGATFVALAGRPPAAKQELEAAGVDAYIHIGIDVLAFLVVLHDTIGQDTIEMGEQGS